ncbi:p-loop containing nucleoside triphosphate hydrolase [Venturia nashicola]|nr:p-loop containing nucleoside triphosphate hydrolase [Venturia nashicola]
MERMKNPLLASKWAPLVPEAAPVATPPVLATVPPALPATSPQRVQSVAQLRRDATPKKKKKTRKHNSDDLIDFDSDSSGEKPRKHNPDHLIDFDSDSSHLQKKTREHNPDHLIDFDSDSSDFTYSTSTETREEAEDSSRIEVEGDEELITWDSDGSVSGQPFNWDTDSDDEGGSEDPELTEDFTSKVHTPAAKGLSSSQAPVIASKDAYFVTHNAPTAPGLATQPPLPLRTLRPSHAANPPPPSRAAAAVAAKNKAPSLLIKAPSLLLKAPSLLLKRPTAYKNATSVSLQASKMAAKSALVPLVTSTMYSSPTQLDYPIAPAGKFIVLLPSRNSLVNLSAQHNFHPDKFLATQITRNSSPSISCQVFSKYIPRLTDLPPYTAVSTLIADSVKICNEWTRPRNLQIDPDEDEYVEDFYKSDILSAEDKDARNKDLTAHAKMLKRSLTNTKVGVDISRAKAEMTITQQRSHVLQLIKFNSVIVVAAATGSGKTTQLPQIILEDAIESGTGADCNVWVTQPRRVAATSVARRVGKERFDGDVHSVGYHVKFDVQLPRPGGCITYCTTGILLNRIQRRPGEVFDNVSHIVVDEAHERDMLIDRLLALLKFHLFTRKQAGLKFPKVIISSATLDVGLFTKYFAQPILKSGLRELVPCPYLDIPGRMFPVKYKYLADILLELQKYPSSSRLFMDQEQKTKDYLSINKEVRDTRGQLQRLGRQTDAQEAIVPAALIAGTIAHIARTTTEGAILVFLPGLDSIENVKKELEVNSPMLEVDFKDTTRFRILILHSDMNDSNDEAFEKMPNGLRKIVLATNIAETSITIPDVVHVIDSGKHKEMVYDPERGLSQLRCGWISQSSCKQRAGRSGRVQNGFYYAVYSKSRFDNMRPTTQPEILRSELQEVSLQLAHQPLDSSVRDFLDYLIEPPNHKAVDAAFIALKEIGALTDDEKITSLGRVLASLPVHPARAKMIVLGIVFRCLDPMLILAAANSMKDIFVRPLDKRQESKACRMRFSGESHSDHLALIQAVDEARSLFEEASDQESRKFLHKNFIHFGRWLEVSRTAGSMAQILIDRGLIPHHEIGGKYWKFGSPELNSNSGNQGLVKALVIAGFHPNIAATHGGLTLRSPQADMVIMASGSVNQDMMKLGQRGQLYTFSEIAKAASGAVWTMKENSAVSPLATILFSRKLERGGDRRLLVDGWLLFTLPADDDVSNLICFKNLVDNVLADAYVQLGGAHEQPAADGLREKILGAIAHSLFLDTQAYEQWLVDQPKGDKKYKRKHRSHTGRGRGGRGGHNSRRG